MPDKKPDFTTAMKGLDFEPVDRLDSKGKKVKATKLPGNIIIMPKLNGGADEMGHQITVPPHQ